MIISSNLTRLISSLALVIFATSCTSDHIGNSLTTITSQQLHKTEGCIRKDLSTCFSSISQNMLFYTEKSLEEAYADYSRTDINGKRIGGDSIFLTGKIVGTDHLLSIIIKPSSTMIVDSIDVILPNDPLFAETEVDYDGTRIYEAAVIVLGLQCPELTKDKIYKFFHNEVKSKSIREDRQQNLYDTSFDIRYFSHTDEQFFCGRKFSYSVVSGYDSHYIDQYNPTGVYKSPTISFR